MEEVIYAPNSPGLFSITRGPDGLLQIGDPAVGRAIMGGIADAMQSVDNATGGLLSAINRDINANSDLQAAMFVMPMIGAEFKLLTSVRAAPSRVFNAADFAGDVARIRADSLARYGPGQGITAMARTSNIRGALQRLSKLHNISRGELSKRFHQIKRIGDTPGAAQNNWIDDVTGDVFDGNSNYIVNVLNHY